MATTMNEGGGKKKSLPAIGAGLTAAFGAVHHGLAAVHKVAEMSDAGHALLATLVLVFFMVHVVIDMFHWRGEVVMVWLVGPVTIAVAVYWWVGFLAKHGLPAKPLMPVSYYPPEWSYFAMCAWLALYCVWDILDARKHEYDDELHLHISSIVLLVGSILCLYLTIRGPQGI